MLPVTGVVNRPKCGPVGVSVVGRGCWWFSAVFALALGGCADDGGGSLDAGTGSTGSAPGEGEDSEVGAGDESTDDAVDDTSAEPSPMCGDAVVEGDEECDDGNDVDGDGCNVDCVPSGSIRWTLVWDGAGADQSSADLVVAGDRVVAMQELAWGDIGSNWERQLVMHVVDAQGVEHGVLSEPSVPTAGVLLPLGIAGLAEGGFFALRLLPDNSYTVTRYDADGAELDAFALAVEGNATRIAAQPGRFAIASETFGSGAWLTGYDGAGTPQWQKTAREPLHIATTPDGAIGMRWFDPSAEIPSGLAAYDSLGDPLFDVPIDSDGALVGIAGAVDGWWLIEAGETTTVTHFAFDGTTTEVASIDGWGYRIAAMPNGDAAVSYRIDSTPFIARLGHDGTQRWETTMPDGVEIWTLGASADGFVWVVGQDAYEPDVSARTHLWGIAP